MKGNYEEQLERERERKGGEGGADPQAVTTEVRRGRRREGREWEELTHRQSLLR